MLDFSLGELTVIGVVALVVLGPERLPRVARTFGEWLGKAQRYVSQVRIDIQREIDLTDLKRLQEEAKKAAQSIDSTVRDAASSLGQAADSPTAAAQDAPADNHPADAIARAYEASHWNSHRFRTRSRPGATFGEIEEAVEQLRSRLSGPGLGRLGRNRHAPRSRVNRARIRR